MTEMPNTFRHAVLLTQRLGIEYLWIDSLCILQDCKVDWAKESHLMQDVYAHAVVNISADAASDSTAGLVSEGREVHGLKVGNLKGGDDVYARRVGETDLSGISHVPEQYGREPSPHILSTRAWVVQERILSPRILHFCHNEIAWECSKHTLCECTVRPRKPVETNFRKALLPPKSDVFQTESAWSQVVAHYSTTKLTRNSDRLIAIAGLASRAASAWKRTYVAGLWKEAFPGSLLWYISKNSSYRLPEYFPSWTWASIRGSTTTWISTFGESNAEFEFSPRIVRYGDLKVHFNHTFDGEIEGSRGWPVNTEDTQEEPVKIQAINELLTRAPELGIIWGRGWLAKIKFNDTRKLFLTQYYIEREAFLPDCSDLSELPTTPNGEIYLLIICALGYHDSGENRRFTKFECLVLRKADSLHQTKGYDFCYQRIGKYYCEVRDDENDFLVPFQKQDIFLV
jgi:hypothetical protein